MRSCLRLVICLACLWPISALQAQVFLVGAGYYASQANGTNSVSLPLYRYSTNLSSGDFRLTLNLAGNIQSQAISYALSPGANNFAFSVASPVSPGNFGGLMLFFNSTGVSFNPGSSPSFAGDLVAVAPTTNTGAFIIPAADILTRSYNGSTTAPYSGDTSYEVGGLSVSITAFSSTNLPSGSFTLNVGSVAVPEPATWAMIALSVSGATAFGWKFRKNRFGRRKKL